MPKKHSDRTPCENIILLLKYMLQEKRFITLNEFEKKLAISKQAITRYFERIDLSFFGELHKKRIGKEVAYKLETKKTPGALHKGLPGLPDFSMVETLWKMSSPKRKKPTK